MKIDYNITGDRRKSFVGALSSRLNLPVKYLGMPSANYEIGEYCISRTGLLEGPDNRELVAQLRGDGFEPVSEEYDGEENFKAQGAPEALPAEPERLSIDMLMTGFSPEKLDNLTKMVAAKALLLKMALDTDSLPIQQVDEDGGKLRFPWFNPDATPEQVHAYVMLVDRLCTVAKEKKRVTAKETDADNPRYAMRCWLLSLGFIGDEYRQARHVLLANLPGSSAYKSKTK